MAELKPQESVTDSRTDGQSKHYTPPGSPRDQGYQKHTKMVDLALPISDNLIVTFYF